MPNTAGSSFFSWLRFGKKKKNKKPGYRPPITSARTSRDPGSPTKYVHAPEPMPSTPGIEPRVDKPRFLDSADPLAPLPPPAAPPRPTYTSPSSGQSQPKSSGSSSSATVMLRVPDGPPQGDVAGILVGLIGPLKNELYRVYAGTTRLGRIDPDNAEKGGEFHDRDMTISRQHGTLVQLDDGAFHIKPLSPKNPISVNGERLEEDGEMLRDRDSVQMGQTTFVFRVLN